MNPLQYGVCCMHSCAASLRPCCCDCFRSLWTSAHAYGCSAVDATGAQDLHLPLAPDGAAAAFGIIVEQAADCCIVKVGQPSSEALECLPRSSVTAHLLLACIAWLPRLCAAAVQVHCKDRPRLLLDTASALAELQMQVATITLPHASTEILCLTTSLLAI